MERWVLSNYRYPLCQYQDHCGVMDKGSWRPLNAREREARMGFVLEHTAEAFSKQDKGLAEREKEHVRCTLLGNSFCSLVVGWIFGQALWHAGILPRPPLPRRRGSRRRERQLSPRQGVVPAPVQRGALSPRRSSRWPISFVTASSAARMSGWPRVR